MYIGSFECLTLPLYLCVKAWECKAINIQYTTKNNFLGRKINFVSLFFFLKVSCHCGVFKNGSRKHFDCDLLQNA